MTERFTKRTAPLMAQVVADFREIFGPDQVQITAVRENNVTIGPSWKEGERKEGDDGES